MGTRVDTSNSLAASLLGNLADICAAWRARQPGVRGMASATVQVVL